MATNIPRRQFIAALGGAAAIWPVAARAQQSAMPVPILGYVAAKNANPKRLEVFRQGLTDLGYAEGRNIRIDYREAILDAEYANHVTELINSKVDIILAANAPAAVAAAHATKTVPIVMLAVNDPVGLSLVKSLEHPDTNVTGTTMYAPQLIGERLRILKSLVPNLDKVSMVLNGNNANNVSQQSRPKLRTVFFPLAVPFRIHDASAKGANRRHEIRLFHAERQPLPRQSALARAIPGGDTRPGGVGRETWTQLGLDRRATLRSRSKASSSTHFRI